MCRISPRVPFARLLVYSRLHFPLDTSILRLGVSETCNLFIYYLNTISGFRSCCEASQASSVVVKGEALGAYGVKPLSALWLEPEWRRVSLMWAALPYRVRAVEEGWLNRLDELVENEPEPIGGQVVH